MSQHLDAPLRTANAIAARATTAYLVGRGLAAEIDDARFPEGFDPIPAPHVDDLIAALGTAAGEACNAGDRVALLRPGSGPDRAVSNALDEAMVAATSAERITRTIAQLLLGVTSQLGENDAVARAERAAVMVLHPIDAAMVPLVDDGLVIHARHRPELVTELCGALCRMIIDHDCVLNLRPTAATDRTIGLRVDQVGNLTASVEASPNEIEQLVDLGWDLGCEGWVEALWSDPLAVAEPARLVVDTLRVLDPASTPTDIVVRVESTD